MTLFQDKRIRLVIGLLVGAALYWTLRTLAPLVLAVTEQATYGCGFWCGVLGGLVSNALYDIATSINSANIDWRQLANPNYFLLPQ